MNKLPHNRRVLIVGEGRETEYNYFVGFRDAFGEELKATATSVEIARGKGGNARGIVENAIQKARRFQPNRRRGDRVFLLLDTEGPERAPELPDADKLAKDKGIEIVYSSPAFEYWLLCHFEPTSRRNFKDCDAVIAELNKKWNKVCATPRYDKADKDVFDRLSVLLNVARAQALAIDLHNLRSEGTACRVNPSTQVYELIAILIGVRADERCPITETWKLIGDVGVALPVNKGEAMPPHGNNAVNWRL